jgi:Flp pilus assembly protein TadG
MFNRTSSKQKVDAGRISRGQAMVEFALISVVALAVMVLGIQYALLGQAALAVSQGASALARYAATHPTTITSGTASGLPTAAQNLLSPTIMTGGGGDLAVTVASITGAGTPETGAIIPSSDQVKITLSYTTASKIFLPSTTLLGATFPATIASTDSQMYE